ncbi:MAG: response regulator [Candidatus Levybacteria bacterium]|nr:response regulator [Candidatus Levybacteria bacterium]
MKVLIVDDSAFMRGILKNIILSMGIHATEIEEAGDGIEAIRKYHQNDPDLVLLDIIMPEKDGVAVLKEIGNLVKVIVISAAGQEKLIEEAKALGAKDFIIKPFDSNKVIETIKSITAK